jgi:hypothetical protein
LLTALSVGAELELRSNVHDTAREGEDNDTIVAKL